MVEENADYYVVYGKNKDRIIRAEDINAIQYLINIYDNSYLVMLSTRYGGVSFSELDAIKIITWYGKYLSYKHKV